MTIVSLKRTQSSRPQMVVMGLVAGLLLAACGSPVAPADNALTKPVVAAEVPAATTAPAATREAPTAAPDLPAGAITAAQAASRVGESATVCGIVASAAWATTSSGGPTFINLDRPYPQEIFTIVIWEEDRDEYPGAPERLFDGKRVCVRGTVEDYRGTPQIVDRTGAISILP